MRIYSFLFFLLATCFSKLLYAQTTPDVYQIPSVTIPLPNAAAFTRYGDLPVGLFTGTMNYSIPLFEIKSGQIAVPISLDYSSNGVRVNDIAGRTGIDWVLKATGVITRNIVGKIDQANTIEVPPVGASANPNGTDSVAFYNWAKYVGDNSLNTQPDEYTYNFMGHSGKFYYDYHGNVRQTSPDGMIINRYNNGLNFELISNDGTKYYFSQKDVNFNTSLYGANNSVNAELAGGTSWFLDKIKNLHSDSIVFTYVLLNSSIVDYVSGLSQTNKVAVPERFRQHPLYMKGSNFSDNYGALHEAAPAYFPENCPLFTAGVQTEISVTNVITNFALSEVLFNGGRVKLHYSGREDVPGEVKVDSIELIRARDSAVLRSIQLTYVYSSSGATYNGVGFKYGAVTPLPDLYPYLKKRLFLSECSIHDRSRNKQEAYKFEYNDINALPPRLSYAQDFWGFFNGKINTYFVPDVHLFTGNTVLDSYSSNRSGDSTFANKGVLKKIIYPTGGFSEMNYSSNKGFVRQRLDSINLIRNQLAQDLSITDTFVLQKAYSLKVKADWIITPDPNGPQPPDPMVVFNIENLTNPSQNLSFLQFQVPVGQQIIHWENLSFLTEGNEYKITVTSTEPEISSEVSFLHWDYESNPEKTYVLGGLHLSSIENYTSEGQVSSRKNYLYSSPNSLTNFSDGRDYSYFSPATCADDFNGFDFVVTSNSILGGYNSDYNICTFSKVWETFDSSGTNGTILTEFLIGVNEMPETFALEMPNSVWDRSPYLIQGAPHSNFSSLNGKEFRKTYYRNEAGVQVPIQKIQHYYSVDSSTLEFDSVYVVRRNFNRPHYSSDWHIWSDYDINRYFRASAWVRLDSSITTNFEGSNSLISKNEFSYGNRLHLQVTNVKSTNSLGDVLNTEIKYPADLLGESPTDQVLQNLVARNIQTVPLKIKTYKGNNPVHTRSVTYNSDLNPSVFKSSFGYEPEQTEREATFYDPLGNMLELKEKDFYTSYLYDSLGMVTAVCNNAQRQDIAFASFEDAEKGSWSIVTAGILSGGSSFTGRKGYQLNGTNTLQKTGLSAVKSYIVSYWTKASTSFTIPGTVGSGVLKKAVETWNYFEHRVTNQTTISITGNGIIDEVRLYPEGAEMSTFTYDNLIGVTCSGDMQSRYQFYAYDAFGRLNFVRDEHGFITKRICYNYQGQLESCSLVPQWIATGSTRCKPCPGNENYQSNVLQHQERDVNTNSPSFNQTRWVDGGVNGNCVVSPDWQFTATSIRCKKNANNENTGEQEREQQDVNPCSGSYNALRWIVVGTNTTTCPLPSGCSPSNCFGEGKKCVNSQCETGYKIYTQSVFNESIFMYECTYHYEFSDGSWSANYVEYSGAECPVW